MGKGQLTGIGTRGIIGKFYDRLETAMSNSWVSQIAMYQPSDQASETYKWLGMSPTLREWNGGRMLKGLRENGYTITNKTFEATIEVQEDDVSDDKTGQLGVRIGELAVRGAGYYRKLMTDAIIAGETTVCYDTQYFFDTDHSEGDSGTQKNSIAAGDYSELNVAAPTNPTADELATCIIKGVQHLYTLKDDQGEPLNEEASQFLVMVPVPFWGAAKTAVNAKMLISGAGVGHDNVLPLFGDISISVVANPRLTWTTKLAIFRTDGYAKPMIVQEKEGLSMEALEAGTEHAFFNQAYVYGVKMKGNVGYGYWQHALLETLS